MRSAKVSGLALLAVLLSASGSPSASVVDVQRSDISSATPVQLTAADVASKETIGRLIRVPIPSAVWLFASGLIGLISVTRRSAT